jgi:hypothetical protein
MEIFEKCEKKEKTCCTTRVSVLKKSKIPTQSQHSLGFFAKGAWGYCLTKIAKEKPHLSGGGAVFRYLKFYCC